MPLNFSSAHSSRITKKSQARPPLLKRSSSSPFANLIRRKPIQRSKSKPESPSGDEDFFEDRLEDAGLVRTLATDLNLSDVVQIIQHVRMHMFDNLPESGGFNSTRIAEILNFRDSLPPTVTVTHVHALTHSPTTTEREISELTKAGVLRKLVIPGRGAGGSNVGEGLALTADIEKLMGCANDVDKSLADQFLADLAAKPLAQSVNSSSYTAARITELMRAGFLTSPSAISSPANLYTRPDSGSADIVTSISSISKAASGSLAAVGGEGAIYDAGGRGGMRRSNSRYETQHVSLTDATMLQFSLPGTGPYIRLLTSARSHLVSLIEKSRFREMPVYLLKERWDGGISADDPAAKAKKYRGEFAGTLPARTRKWKQFYGLSFGFVLAECLGAGLIELFDTGTVGRAVRIV
ncbi:MAG: hypothetical protein Q9164_005890 [Protoblastenia rupestris]